MRRVFFLSVFLLSILLRVLSVYGQDPIEAIYLIPSDQQKDMNKIVVLDKLLKDVQSFYADEMERHGFGRKTFPYNQEIRVHHGKHTLKEYLSHDNFIWFELSRQTGLPEYLVDVVFMEGTERLSGNVAGAALPFMWGGDKRVGIDPGYTLVWLPVQVTEWLIGVLAHELGHAFGLHHTEASLIDGKWLVMSVKSSRIRKIEKYALSLKEANILDKSVSLSVIERSPIASEGDGIDADVNNDGYVDLSDVRIVRSAIKNTNSYDTDVNNDGKTDELDVLIVKAKAHEAIAAAAPSLQRKRILTGTWGALKKR